MRALWRAHLWWAVVCVLCKLLAARESELSGRTLQAVLYELSFRRSLPDGVTKSHALPPYGSATSHDGSTLYFGEPSKHRIQAIDVETGAVRTVAGGGSRGFLDGADHIAKFSWPYGIATSQDHRTLYVADSGNACLRSIDLDSGMVTTIAGGAGRGLVDGRAGHAKFSWPYGVAAAPNGRVLYVADSGNHCVRQVDVATGMVTTLAGDGTAGFRDGPADTARFYGPRGLATSADGEHLFVADYANSVVRWVRLGDASYASHRNPNDSVGRTVATLPSPVDGGWQPYAVGRRGSIGGGSLATGAAAVDDRHYTATTVSSAEANAAELAHRPAGVAVTPDGRALLTADAGNTEVHIFWLQDVGLMPVERAGWGHREQAEAEDTSSWDAAAADVHAATQARARERQATYYRLLILGGSIAQAFLLLLVAIGSAMVVVWMLNGDTANIGRGHVPASPGRGIGWQRPQSSVAIPVKEARSWAIEHEQSRPRTRLERTTTDPLVYLQALDMRPELIQPSPSMPQMPPQQSRRLRRSQDIAAQDRAAGKCQQGEGRVRQQRPTPARNGSGSGGGGNVAGGRPPLPMRTRRKSADWNMRHTDWDANGWESAPLLRAAAYLHRITPTDTSTSASVLLHRHSSHSSHGARGSIGSPLVSEGSSSVKQE